MLISCPHCGAKGNVRSSRRLSENSKEAYVQCTNLDCCHHWKVIVSAVETVAPSYRPNPKVLLPEVLSRIAAAIPG